MPIIVLSSEEVERALKFIDRPQELPEKILRLRSEILEETEKAERKSKERGFIDNGDVNRIVAMKLRLDDLYLQIAQGTFIDD